MNARVNSADIMSDLAPYHGSDEEIVRVMDAPSNVMVEIVINREQWETWDTKQKNSFPRIEEQINSYGECTTFVRVGDVEAAGLIFQSHFYVMGWH